MCCVNRLLATSTSIRNIKKRKYKMYKYNIMEKLYSFKKLNLAGLFTFIVMMVGMQLGTFAQSSDDCIAPAQPIQTYYFLTTQDGGANWDTMAIKIIKSGDVVPHPEFNIIDYSTFDSWYTVDDPDMFSAANKFDDNNFSTPQIFE